MPYSSTNDLLAEVSRFGDALKALDGMVDGPRDEMRQHVQTLQASFESLQTQLTTGLELRDQFVQRIEDAAEQVRVLDEQVREMNGKILRMQARIDMIEAPNDPSASRH